MMTVQDYAGDDPDLRCDNSEVGWSIRFEPGAGGDAFVVAFPAATADEAGRDVWIGATVRDWSRAEAIVFRARADRDCTISLSFVDAKGVAYTTWRELTGGRWQDLRIAFDDIAPNPYFQPPGADPSRPLDVSDVDALGFAPRCEDGVVIALSAIRLA